MQKRFESIANPLTGRTIAGVSVQVNVAGGSAATIYSDNGVTTRANPIITDANGYFEYFAADGLYDWVISGGGLTARTIEDVLHEDPLDSANGLVLIERKTVTDVATADFVTGINTAYDEYILKVAGLVPSSSGGQLLMRFSNDAGATFNAGATQATGYSRSDAIWSASNALQTTQTRFLLADAVSNSAGLACHGEVKFRFLHSTTLHKVFRSDFDFIDGAGLCNYRAFGYDTAGSAAAVNGIRLYMSAGNITSAKMALYGSLKSS